MVTGGHSLCVCKTVCMEAGDLICNTPKTVKQEVGSLSTAFYPQPTPPPYVIKYFDLVSEFYTEPRDSRAESETDRNITIPSLQEANNNPDLLPV